MFFNVGGVELLVIALVALVVVGPEQLPGLMRRAGRTANQVRSMSINLRDEFMRGVDEINPNSWEQGGPASGRGDRSELGADGAPASRGTGAMDDPIVPRTSSAADAAPAGDAGSTGETAPAGDAGSTGDAESTAEAARAGDAESTGEVAPAVEHSTEAGE